MTTYNGTSGVPVFAALFSWALFVALPWHATANGQTEFEIREGYMLFEGDILLPVDYFEQGGVATAYTKEGRLWKDGIVPYEYADGVQQWQRDNARFAMDQWEAVANVQFVPRNGENDHLFILRSDENVSEGVGHGSGRHKIHIVSWDVPFIIAHELGHALGYWHEQSRSDRLTYINIIESRISPDGDGQFDPRRNGDEYGPYDFDSVMHYNQCSFSNCGTCSYVDNTFAETVADPSWCTTIVVRSPYDTHWQSKIGQRNHLSLWDGLVMAFLYPRSNWRFLEYGRNALSPAGDYFGPYGSWEDAVDETPVEGILWVLNKGTTIPANGTYSKRMKIIAPWAGVVLGG